jgi:hypothetical protein
VGEAEELTASRRRGEGDPKLAIVCEEEWLPPEAATVCEGAWWEAGSLRVP